METQHAKTVPMNLTVARKLSANLCLNDMKTTFVRVERTVCSFVDRNTESWESVFRWVQCAMESRNAPSETMNRRNAQSAPTQNAIISARTLLAELCALARKATSWPKMEGVAKKRITVNCTESSASISVRTERDLLCAFVQMGTIWKKTDCPATTTRQLTRKDTCYWVVTLMGFDRSV